MPEISTLVGQQLGLLLSQGNLSGAKALLTPVQAVDIAEAIEALADSQQAMAFRLLPKDEAIEVYEHFDSSTQQALIEHLKQQDILDIVDKMSPDDRARLFDELPSAVVTTLLGQLSPSEKAATALLLGYEANTAGRIMTPEYVALQERLNVGEALAHIRGVVREKEMIYYLFVVDETRTLTGIISLRELMVAQPQHRIEDLMTREVVSVTTDVDQKEVARLIQRYDFLAVPVVDHTQKLLGIVTVDDVLDILETESTQDIYKLGGVQGDGDDYFQANIFTVVRKRALWLFVLLLTNTFTGTIIDANASALAQAVSLAVFIPLLIGTGGNVGAQSSTVIIRGLNTKSLGGHNTWAILLREFKAGALLGLVLGSLTTIWAATLIGAPWNVAIVVGLSLWVIATGAALSGAGLPLFFAKLGFDPALMSAPLITTIVDVLGVLAYFQLAKAILNLN